MRSHSERQSARVGFSAAVLLSTDEPRADAAPMLAQSIDVSNGGMRVRTTAALSVGHPVLCSLLVGSTNVDLPGRVVWTRGGHDHGAAVSAGIAFCQPSSSTARLLRGAAVSRSATEPRPVRLHFAGVPYPVRAYGTAGDGLCVSAKLGVLAPGTPLEVEYVDSQSRWAARVERVWLETAAPVPELRMHIARGESPRLRRETRYLVRPANCGRDEPARSSLRAGAIATALTARPTTLLLGVALGGFAGWIVSAW